MAHPEFTCSVSVQYLPEQSDPKQQLYAFAYTVTIRNTGDVAAQLISRHWIITDALGKVQEVRGEGVVGEQPVLMPGAVFEYSSGAVLETPLGKMEGSYQMIGEDGLPFEAPIKTFRLAVPNVLN
jgi:ApaG protein